jgi:hypothetical protein
MQAQQIDERIREICSGNSRPKRGELARLIAKRDSNQGAQDRQRKSREKREAGQRKESQTFVWKSGFLKPGPRPDPSRQNLVESLTFRSTKREARELARLHAKMCSDASQSTFLRFVVCQWLEAQRDPQRVPLRFDIDPAALDYRTKLPGRGASRGRVASEASHSAVADRRR